MSPLVTVIIPVYNGVRYLERALTSVAHQTFRDFEAIVVDDGSRDGSAEVAEAFARAHPELRIFVVRQPNRRQAAARNAGIERASGELLAFLDVDDRWYPEKLERCVGALRGDPRSVLVCHAEYVVHGGRVVGVNRYGPDAAASYERLLLNGNCVSTSAEVVRRDAVLALGGFDERPEFYSAEDYDLWMRLSRLGRFLFLDIPLGEYQLEAKSSSRDLARHAENVRAVVEAHFAALERAGRPLPEAVRRRRLARVYRHACLDTMLTPGTSAQRWVLLGRAVRAKPLDLGHLPVLVACLAPGVARGLRRLRAALAPAT